MSKYTDVTNWHTRSGSKYRTLAPVTWEIGRLGSGLKITVPAGYLFDVSVPWAFRWLIDPHDTRFLKAACLHDYTLEDGWDRVACAAVLADALKADGVSRSKRLAATLAVVVWKFH